jgi:hypothetical protein
VAHCGESMAGEFCWSITATDVHTQWTESRAVCNRGQHLVQQRIAEIEAALPFDLLGFDTDNGCQFLNWHLFDYFDKRPAPVRFTRSRAYRKNDNAHVEQKIGLTCANWWDTGAWKAGLRPSCSMICTPRSGAGLGTFSLR